jgi:cysteine desulfurase/selenocysteine lyase
MLGPTGVGVLYVKEDALDLVEPLAIGGGSIDDVGIDYFKLAKSPMRFEAGTPPIAEAIGLGEAINYLRNIGVDRIHDHEKRLAEALQRGLEGVSRVKVYGPKKFDDRVGIVSFNVGDMNPHDVALLLDSADIMVRSGLHCAHPLMKELLRCPNGTVRASLYLYNLKDEVDKFIEVVSQLSEGLET